jgi:PDZ domain-containing protein
VDEPPESQPPEPPDAPSSDPFVTLGGPPLGGGSFGGGSFGVPFPPAPRHRSALARALIALGTAVAVFIAAVVVWGFVHHPGYDEFLPGDTEAVGPLISVHGAPQYKVNGGLQLVFVRERADLNEWQYLWAKAFKGVNDITPSGPGSQTANEQQDVCDMVDSQVTAKQVALQKLGYKVPTQPGVVVQEIALDAPAAGELQCDDVIRSVDGHTTDSLDALHSAIAAHKPGDVIDIGFDRGNKHLTRAVKLVRDNDGKPLIGIGVGEHFVYPVGLTIATADIGGPSAGLAMTLALLDELTKGALTGGKRVAATGTINPDASVGEIGEIRLKAISARRRGVQIFLVPACTDTDPLLLSDCKKDLAAADHEAKGIKVIPVRTLDQALQALRANGGDPLPQIVHGSAAAH